MLLTELLPWYLNPKLKWNSLVLSFWILRLGQATQKETQHLGRIWSSIIYYLLLSAGSLVGFSFLRYNFLSRNDLLRNYSALFNGFSDLIQKCSWFVLLAAPPLRGTSSAFMNSALLKQKGNLPRPWEENVPYISIQIDLCVWLQIYTHISLLFSCIKVIFIVYSYLCIDIYLYFT